MCIDMVVRFSGQEREIKQLRDECDQEIRAVKNKHEAAIEFTKQESHLSSVKVGCTCSRLKCVNRKSHWVQTF